MSTWKQAWSWLSARAHAAAQPTHLIGLSLFRVLCGLNILGQYLLVYHQRHFLFGNEGMIPYAYYVEGSGQFSLYWFVDSAASFELLYHASVLIVALWTLGYATRWLSPLVLLCWTSLLDRGPRMWDGGDNLAYIVLVFACFADLGAHFRAGPSQPVRAVQRSPLLGVLHATAVRAIALQVCTVYLVAGLAKASGSTWLDGTGLYHSWVDGEFGWPGVTDALYRNELLLNLLGPLTILFQISFPFLFLLHRHTRRVVLALAIGFHASIGVLMGLVSFAIFFIAAELALVSDREYRALARGASWLYQRAFALLPLPLGRVRAREEARTIGP